MLYKKRNIFAFILSVIIHSIIFGLIFLTLDRVALHASNKTVISLKTIKIKKPKPVIKKTAPKKPKKIIKPQPKPKPKPKPKPVVKPKPKPKPIIKPKPKKVIKHKPKHTRKIKPPKKIRPHIRPKPKKPQPNYMQPPKKLVESTRKQKQIPNRIKSAAVQPKADMRKQYLHLNFSKILQAIDDAKFYPPKARMLDIEGNVKVEFTLQKNGQIENIQVKTDKRFLGRAAIEIVKKASSDFPKPPEDIRISVTIEFRLDE